MTEADIRTLIFETIVQIAPEIDSADISATENLREELDIDSFDFLKLLIALSEQLSIEIPEQDYERLISLNDLVTYLKDRLAENKT